MRSIETFSAECFDKTMKSSEQSERIVLAKGFSDS